MKTEKNILIAFILNAVFAIFEFVGGFLTGSVAIASDALHDFGDAASIGVSYLMERKSKKKPDERHTYGYGRYSVVGGFITTAILFIGSIAIIWNAIERLRSPVELNYNGMLIFAVIGVIVNGIAAYVTREGNSVNQRAVNLHMFEDVLGWVVVLVGALVMKFTDYTYIDPILSIITAAFILYSALQNMRSIMQIFTETTPDGVHTHELLEHLQHIDGVEEIHHLHVWTMDGNTHYATLHTVTNADTHHIKHAIREECEEHGIRHVTIETEHIGEECHERECHPHFAISHGHHHHHGHTHHH